MPCRSVFDDVFQPLLEVVQHRVHVVLLHLLAAAVLELLHELAQAGHLLAVAVLHPLAQQVAEGLHDVAVVEDVVRQHIHQLVGRRGQRCSGFRPTWSSGTCERA